MSELTDMLDTIGLDAIMDFTGGGETVIYIDDPDRPEVDAITITACVGPVRITQDEDAEDRSAGYRRPEANGFARNSILVGGHHIPRDQLPPV